MFLIFDSPRAHRARDVKDRLAERTDAIEAFYLLSYPSETNPNEYLNRDVKTVCAARNPKTTRTKHGAPRARPNGISATHPRARSCLFHIPIGLLCMLHQAFYCRVNSIELSRSGCPFQRINIAEATFWREDARGAALKIKSRGLLRASPSTRTTIEAV